METAEPGVAGAILSIFCDPVAALAFARGIDRDYGRGTAKNLQEAAIAALAPKPLKGSNK